MIDHSKLSESYQQLSGDYVNVLESLTEDQINHIPGKGGWCAGQVINHITKANQSSFLTVDGLSADRNIGEQIPDLANTFLNFGIKMTAPDFLIPENKIYTKQECIGDIKQCFQSLIDALPGSKLDEILNTPLGSLTKWEIANFVVFHSKRHLFQLQNIQKALQIDHKKELASAFSDGRFTEVYDYLADDVKWTVVAERETFGKKDVIHECEKIAIYFASVTTDFQTHFVISEGNTVVVNGTGEFLREGKRISFISASEVYEFNDSGQIVDIKSYCIQEKI